MLGGGAYSFTIPNICEVSIGGDIWNQSNEEFRLNIYQYSAPFLYISNAYGDSVRGPFASYCAGPWYVGATYGGANLSPTELRIGLP